MVMPFVKCTPQPHPPTTIGRPMVVPLFQPIPHWTAHQYCRPTQAPPCNFICGSSTCAIFISVLGTKVTASDFFAPQNEADLRTLIKNPIFLGGK